MFGMESLGGHCPPRASHGMMVAGSARPTDHTMYDDPVDNTERRSTDEVTDLVVRGVFAFTLALAAAGARMAGRRRDQLLTRQDPRLN